MGIYLLLADDSHEGYESNAEWEPELYEYQQKGSNVLFFSFIHPQTMQIPPGIKTFFWDHSIMYSIGRESIAGPLL